MVVLVGYRWVVFGDQLLACLLGVEVVKRRSWLGWGVWYDRLGAVGLCSGSGDGGPRSVRGGLREK